MCVGRFVRVCECVYVCVRVCVCVFRCVYLECNNSNKNIFPYSNIQL